MQSGLTHNISQPNLNIHSHLMRDSVITGSLPRGIAFNNWQKNTRHTIALPGVKHLHSPMKLNTQKFTQD